MSLFEPIQVGKVTASTRIVLAPLTRFRSSDDHVPLSELAATYYAQRAGYPGTLLIAEATDVSPFSGGYKNVPGIYSDAQVEGWRRVADAVHAKGSFLFVQLWALGRVNPGILPGRKRIVSASDVPVKDRPTPEPLSQADIKAYVHAFATAARNAVAAGADGIEIHSAHGYLVDQFLQDVTNKRTDMYGGSIENRARFLLEIVAACAAYIGAERVAVRLSPFAFTQGMKMADPMPQFVYVAQQLQTRFPKLAYLHLVEPRVSGLDDVVPVPGESHDPIRAVWHGVIIIAGGFTPETAAAHAKAYPKELVAFGRYFTSNPDLVARIKEGIPLEPYDRSKFYLRKSPDGYVTYGPLAAHYRRKVDPVSQTVGDYIVRNAPGSSLSHTMASQLFTPLKVGDFEVSNRIVMAPLTRFRNSEDNVPQEDLAVPHYAQRAGYPGTLIIAEATDVSSFSGGFPFVPGVHTDAQIEGWKKVTDAIHAKGSFAFLQLWAIGRSNPGVRPGYETVVSASTKPMEGGKTPLSLSVEEIASYVAAFADASKKAIAAGFDGIEIHAAHGYLIDQFLQDVSNERTDSYGGSIENRARFALEIVEACTAAIGASKVAIRLSPFSAYQSMKMDDPMPTFTYVVEQLQAKFPGLAYLHMVEPRVSGSDDREPEDQESNDLIRAIWKGPYMAAGGFTPESAAAHIEKYPNELIAFGRLFIPNPDLVARIKENIPLEPYDRSNFYTPQTADGYLTYTVSDKLTGTYAY
ncbi:uncharacterized protein V1510DRAFT_394683 [Dipodascopsis tothii]|uniref:uncharacterized protein n=1 Tax=Dipodascopsis tothii TaxID=44089 RepID=UPI0034CD2583